MQTFTDMERKTEEKDAERRARERTTVIERPPVRADRAEREREGGRLRGRGMSCAFNAHLARRCNKIDILIPLNLRMPVS